MCNDLDGPASINTRNDAFAFKWLLYGAFQAANSEVDRPLWSKIAQNPAGFPAEPEVGDPVLQNGISSSRSTSSGFSFSADFGRLRKSTFSAMISQP